MGKSTFGFTNENIVLNGGSTTISITRDSSSYSHKLYHPYGAIATLAAGIASYTWTPTADDLVDFFKDIPNQTSAMIDVYLDTYDGSTLVGRDIHALTITLSEATGKPSVSEFAIVDHNTITSGMGVMIPGRSSLSASETVTSKYGSSIVKTVYVYDQKEYTNIDDLIGSLPLTKTPTRYSISCVATDSRGFMGSVITEGVFANYEGVTIDIFEVVRCDSDGNETEIGTNAKIIVKGSWCSFSGKNGATLKIGHKVSTDEDYTYQTISVADGIVDVEEILAGTFDASTSYEFSVSLTDSFTTYVESGKEFVNCKNIIYVSGDGEELSFDATTINIGKKGATINFAGGNARIKYQKDEGFSELTLSSGNSSITFEKDEEGNEYVNIFTKNSNTGQYGTVGIMNGELFADSLSYGTPVLSNADCNSLVDNGVYFLKGASNRPVERTGWLEVLRLDDDNVHQIYTIDTGGYKYVRTKTSGTWGKWHEFPLYTGTFDGAVTFGGTTRFNGTSRFTNAVRFDSIPTYIVNGAETRAPYCRTNGVSFEWVVSPYAALKIYVDNTCVATLRGGTST